MTRVEMDGLLKETARNNPSLKDFCEEFSPFTIGTRIYALKSVQEVLDWQKTFGKVVLQTRKYRDDKKLTEQKKKNDEELEAQKRINRILDDMVADSKRHKE